MSVVTPDNKDKKLNEPNHWEISVDKKSIYTNDDIIDAYLKGKEMGIKEKEQIFVEKLNENIKKSAHLTKSMLIYLKQNGFKPKSAHLKINSFDSFVILVTVPENEYISEKFLETYQYASTLENDTLEDQYFNPMFIFSDRKEDSFNKNLLVTEGFFMDYKTDQVEA